MLCFFRKSILFKTQMHITTISPTFSVQNPWLSVKYISSSSNSKYFAVSYLINTCGFSPEKAASASKSFSFQTREKPDLVIDFFKKQGFSQTQILGIIRARPRLIKCNPEKVFLPKIEFFKSKGVLCSDMPKMISACPEILRRSLLKQIIPSFDFFMSLFQSEEKLIKALKRCSGILSDLNTSAIHNIKLLREEGVPESHIIKLLEWHNRALTGKPDGFEEIVRKVKEMRLDPLRITFVVAVGTMVRISKSTWTRKADIYKRWGWSDDDIFAAFGKHPSCIRVSEDKIEAIMEFFVKEMGCESSTISRYPGLLDLSFKKRIVPRASVFQVLLSKGLVKKLPFSQVFFSSESIFLQKYIMRYKNEANELLKLYQEKMDA